MNVTEENILLRAGRTGLGRTTEEEETGRMYNVGFLPF